MKAIVLAVLVACSASKSPNELTGDGLTPAEYQQAGLPAIDHPWTVDEHTAAAAALATLSAGHREKLPRRDGAKSGPVFAKLTEIVADDASVPLGTRAVAHSMRYEAANKVSKLYVVDAMGAPNREWLALVEVLLTESATMFTLIDPFLAQFTADDPSRAAREGGVAKMRAGTAGLLLGALMMIADQRIPETDRVALATKVAEVFGTLYPKLEPAQQQPVRDQLAKLHGGLKAGPLRSALPPTP